MGYVVSIAGIRTTAKPRYQRRRKLAQAVPLDQRVIRASNRKKPVRPLEDDGRWASGSSVAERTVHGGRFDSFPAKREHALNPCKRIMQPPRWPWYNSEMEHYHFPPMLGPASGKPEGSYEWAECYGNELDYHVERLADEVDHFAEIIGKLVVADPPPWTIFPKPPCRTADAFLRLCGGMTQEQTATVLAACGHTALADVVRDL